MKNTSFLFSMTLTLIFLVLLSSALFNETALSETKPTTSFIATFLAPVTVTTSISEAPYSSQYYFMDVKLTGISLLKGDNVEMFFPLDQCYFGQHDLSLRCYNLDGPVPSIPPREGDDLIEPILSTSFENTQTSTCSYSFGFSTSPVPDGGTIRCLVYNVYSPSVVNPVETQMTSITIGALTFTGLDISSETFYTAKPLADFFEVSLGAKTMTIPYHVTNFNNEEVSASIQVDQLVIKYFAGLPPNLKVTINPRAQFTTTTDETCEPDFVFFFISALPTGYNSYITSDIFSPTSAVPLINQPATDIGVFFDLTSLYFFTGPNPDQNPGIISIPISMQAAFLTAQAYFQSSQQISCFHSFTADFKELKSANILVGVTPYDDFTGVSDSLAYPITLLNQIPIEFTDGTRSLSIADDQMVLELRNGIVYGNDVYDFELLSGYTNGNDVDFFSRFDEIRGRFLPRTDPPGASPIDSSSFTDRKLNFVIPEGLSFLQANLELDFPRLMDQDGVNTTPVTPSILRYSLYQREYTVGHIPFPAFTPLDSKTSLEIQVSNTKATMSAQFALSEEVSNVLDPTVDFNVDAIFTLRPHRLMGELFSQAHPIPICTLVGAPPTLRIMPHVYSPTGADVHTTAGIRIAGTMPWGSKITMNCEQEIVPGVKTGNAKFLAFPWVLRLFPHRVYIQKHVDLDVVATYDNSWEKQEVVATSPFIYVQGPGIDNEAQFNFVVDKVVEFIQNYAPTEDPNNKIFGHFNSSGLHWTTSDDPAVETILFGYYNVSLNFGPQIAYPTNDLHLATTQKSSLFAFIPDISLDPNFTWPPSTSRKFYPELSLQAPIYIQFQPVANGLVRYHNSLDPNQPAPIPYGRNSMYALTNFPWLTSADGPCFSSLQCDFRFQQTASDSFWQPLSGICFEGSCSITLAVHVNKISQAQAHIFNPQKRRPDEFTMTGKANIVGGGMKDIIIRGSNEFGFGYVSSKFVVQFTSAFSVSLDTMINEQHVIIDNDNSEFPSIVGKKYTIQLLSFPSSSTGDIISPTLFRVHWTSPSTSIPVAETLSHLDISAGVISAVGASKMKFRVVYPDLFTTPTAANPNPMTYLDSIFFTSMSSCMASPVDVSTYSDPSQWTNQCKNGGQCQSAGCKCVNGYNGSLCATPPLVPTGCMAAPTTFCGAHGTCNQATLRCDCLSGWLGSSCTTKEGCAAIGRDVCSNNGHFLTNPATEQCDDGKCECDNLWIGSKCSICSLSCKNGGRAHKLCTTCGCAAGFAGAQCTCSQQQASFTIAMDNDFVAYVNSARSDLAAAQGIVDISTIDISTLNLPEDVLSEYLLISDAVVQDLLTSLGFSATTTSTATLTMNTIVNSLPPKSGGDTADDSGDHTYISTRFSFTLTYNCNQDEQINLQQVWNSQYIALLPTQTIKTYFTSTRINPLPEDVGITTSPGTLNGDYTIDTDNQPKEENSAPQFVLVSMISFCAIIVFLLV